jgi:hypothetical protein
MTQEQKQIKLAEAGGWTKVHESWTGQKTACFPNDSQRLPLPDYFNDLNAVHELEKLLTPLQWFDYSALLTKIVGPKDQEYYLNLHATASQRAEALGLSLKLW